MQHLWRRANTGTARPLPTGFGRWSIPRYRCSCAGYWACSRPPSRWCHLSRRGTVQQVMSEADDPAQWLAGWTHRTMGGPQDSVNGRKVDWMEKASSRHMAVLYRRASTLSEVRKLLPRDAFPSRRRRGGVRLLCLQARLRVRGLILSANCPTALTNFMRVACEMLVQQRSVPKASTPPPLPAYPPPFTDSPHTSPPPPQPAGRSPENSHTPPAPSPHNPPNSPSLPPAPGSRKAKAKATRTPNRSSGGSSSSSASPLWDAAGSGRWWRRCPRWRRCGRGGRVVC